MLDVLILFCARCGSHNLDSVKEELVCLDCGNRVKLQGVKTGSAKLDRWHLGGAYLGEV